MNQKCFSIKTLADELESSIPEIDFAYLFGSSSDGKVKTGSDVDVAVYLSKSVSLKVVSKISKIIEQLTSSPGDLCILNNASEILRFEVLKGRLLFVRPDKLDEYSGFYSLTCREYEDKIIWMQKQRALRGYA